MATAINLQFSQPLPMRSRAQSVGNAHGSATRLRVVEARPAETGCEVVLSPEEYRQFEEVLAEPARVIPELAALLRRRR